MSFRQIAFLKIMEGKKLEIEYKLREKSVASSTFIHNSLDRYKGQEPIEIDAIGIQLSSARDALRRLIRAKKLPSVNVRFLILKPKSPGAQFRGLLEGKNEPGDEEEMNEIALGAIRNMKKINKMFKTYDKDCSFQLRQYRFTPGFMLIRVNDMMMINNYFATIAYDTPYEVLEKPQYPFRFNLYREYFDTVFSSDKLSDKYTFPKVE